MCARTSGCSTLGDDAASVAQTLLDVAKTDIGDVETGGGGKAHIAEYGSQQRTVKLDAETPLGKYSDIIGRLQALNIHPRDLGQVLAEKFLHQADTHRIPDRNADGSVRMDGDQPRYRDLTAAEDDIISGFFVLLNFEAAHSRKNSPAPDDQSPSVSVGRMQHMRDLVNGIMLAQMLSQGRMSLEDLRRLPTAGMYREKDAKEAMDARERIQEEGLEQVTGIQAGRRAVTETVIGRGDVRQTGSETEPFAQGFGRGDFPQDLRANVEVALARELDHFTRWLEMFTGDDALSVRAFTDDNLDRATALADAVERALVDFLRTYQAAGRSRRGDDT